MSNGLSYTKVGINIDESDAVKNQMKRSIDKGDPRVLNTLGAFASLVEGRFEGYSHPILVLKTEEPGSKQKLAFKHHRVASIAYDLINHLINDIMVMGADPFYVQDCIVCGKLESEVVKLLVDNIAEACREQGCVLTGGETSIQPGIIANGEYVLSASAIGVVDKNKIVDGSTIKPGDIVLAVASNGLHTNGYTLVRALLDMKPELEEHDMEGGRFLDIIMRPHKCYYQPCKGLFGQSILKGMAHITGGGIRDNIARILPNNIDALVNLPKMRVPEVFKIIRSEGNVSDEEMLRTFNMGVGLVVVVAPESKDQVIHHFNQNDCLCYEMGSIVEGRKKVQFNGFLMW